MKIFLNLLSAYSGGQITRAIEFLNLIDQQDNLEVLVLKQSSTLNDIPVKSNVKLINKSNIEGPMRSLRRMAWEDKNIYSIMSNNKSEVYLTFSHYLPKSISSNYPSIVGVSNLAPFSPEAWSAESLKSKLRLFMLRKTILSSCRRATRVLALSNTCKEILTANGIDGKKIIVASNGVSDFWELSSPEDFREELGIDMPYILYVSHFYFYKNFETLITAYKKLDAKLREKNKLVLVGSPLDKACYNETLALINRLQLNRDVIIFTGLSKDKLRCLYQNTELFIFASLIENSPNILLEAMKSGSPILTTNLQPMPEFCGNSADYFSGLDTQELTSKISLLLNNLEKRNAMKIKSRLRAKNFTWDNFTKKIIKEVRSIN